MVYITSDIHGAFDIHKINPREFLPGQHMTKDDYLVICGDFGCLWDGGSSDQFWMNWLESLPWTTVFIDGNHENFDVISSYPAVDWKGGKTRQIRSNVFYLMRGEIFDFGGKSWLALGGGFSHDAQFRTQGLNWWNEEIFTEQEACNARKNLEKRNWKVDCVLSHNVFLAHPLHDKYEQDMSIYTDDRIHQQQFLEEIRKKTDYGAWFCGHYHKDRVDFFDSKPCFMLYDRVENVDTLLEEAGKLESQSSGQGSDLNAPAAGPLSQETVLG